jgi:phenylpropionate dioxygenase-like ring-hydroxylating dioxygenase large terminal subunit
MAKSLLDCRFFLVPLLLLLCCGSLLPVVESLSSSSSTSTSSTSISTTKNPVGVVTSLNRIELGLKKFPRSWVPIASTFELDPDRPTPLQFLGQSYVTYQDNEKQWIVLDDRCPHRLAPLSEGRIDRDTDTLECSYHGWAFSSTGACRRIPQVPEAVVETVMTNSKSCVASYPTHVEQGILWMWPWPEDVLSVQADGSIAATPEALMAYSSGRGGTATSSYTRDLPYGWDTLVENLIDPSHVPFAHHGLQGKRTDATPINMTVPISKKGAAGFSFEFGDRTNDIKTAQKQRRDRFSSASLLSLSLWYVLL